MQSSARCFAWNKNGRRLQLIDRLRLEYDLHMSEMREFYDTLLRTSLYSDIEQKEGHMSVLFCCLTEDDR